MNMARPSGAEPTRYFRIIRYVAILVLSGFLRPFLKFVDPSFGKINAQSLITSYSRCRLPDGGAQCFSLMGLFHGTLDEEQFAWDGI
jgi:hypothetical protein